MKFTPTNTFLHIFKKVVTSNYIKLVSIFHEVFCLL